METREVDLTARQELHFTPQAKRKLIVKHLVKKFTHVCEQYEDTELNDSHTREATPCMR